MSPYKAFLESCPVESRLYCQWWKAARLPFTVGTPNYKSANTLRPFLFSLNVAWAPLLFALPGAEHVNSRGLKYPPKRVKEPNMLILVGWDIHQSEWTHQRTRATTSHTSWLLNPCLSVFQSQSACVVLKFMTWLEPNKLRFKSFRFINEVDLITTKVIEKGQHTSDKNVTVKRAVTL